MVYSHAVELNPIRFYKIQRNPDLNNTPPRVKLKLNLMKLVSKAVGTLACGIYHLPIRGSSNGWSNEL
ncbi:hypothetical protein N7495_000355 [Penicillium taxi]|uniref:uncharacterized protein n=1 Tax=Penicillium taxi TaxID=168475 RepID=UPI0025456F96|nr:uncharacterized protein N7495_000355 [Penicillium taxi]KAJ5907673.1 hypothetical protein N7495_000355 [Penicillium taxi]